MGLLERERMSGFSFEFSSSSALSLFDQMLRSSAILEVTTVDQAKLAEDTRACVISELRLSTGVAISARP